MKLKNISNQIKKEKIEAKPIGLPFIIKRKFDNDTNRASAGIDYLIECKINNLGLENKANAYSISAGKDNEPLVETPNPLTNPSYYEANVPSFISGCSIERWAIQLYKLWEKTK